MCDCVCFLAWQNLRVLEGCGRIAAVECSRSMCPPGAPWLPYLSPPSVNVGQVIPGPARLHVRMASWNPGRYQGCGLAVCLAGGDGLKRELIFLLGG